MSTRRRARIHAKFLQEPPIAVLSVFKVLDTARMKIRERPGAQWTLGVELYLLGSNLGDTAYVLDLYQNIRFSARRSREKFRRRRLLGCGKCAIPPIGAAAAPSRRNGVIIGPHDAYCSNRKDEDGNREQRCLFD